MNYKKIAIVGISASGKSIFSRRVAQETGLPLFHMDNLFWKNNWEEIPEAEYLIEHELLIQKDEWIIEGYVDKKMANRLKEADVVLYLDYPSILCAWRILLRFFKHRKESRPELPPEALEKLKLRRIWVVLTRGERHDIEDAIQAGNPRLVKRFHSPKELEKFINNMPMALIQIERPEMY